MPRERRSSISVQSSVRIWGSSPTVGSSSRISFGFVDEAAGEQQAPAHAAGELVDGVAAALAQAGQVERPVDRGADVRHAVEARVHREVVLDRDVDVEVVELRHDAHLGPGRLGVAGQLVAEHAQLARVGDRLAGEQPHRRRLAGAVGPEQAEADALGHLEVEPVDRRDRAEALDRAAELYRRHVPILDDRRSRPPVPPDRGV